MFKSILLSLALLSSFSVFSQVKVIYGDDNRLDVFESHDSLLVEASKSTAAQIAKSSLAAGTSGTYNVNGPTLIQRGMCKTERFANQITAARCSGFLVGEDLLVTAGHCVTNQTDCNNNSWVFDYKQPSRKGSIKVPASSIYSCKQIINQILDRPTQNDFALIRLDRKVTGRQPLLYRKTGKIANNANVAVIGHPTGLPTKIADGAVVRANANSIYFVANLDTYGGNSGSAVFDSKTGMVEGILVRGENDYVTDPNQNCQVSNVCPATGCRGEDVTRITNIKELLKKYLD